MYVTQELFGKTPKGEPADLFTLKNSHGSAVKLTNYGGIITDILLPDRNGELVNAVLGFDRLEDYYSESYLRQMPYFGAIIGRYANRIRNGRFRIGEKTYQIPNNLGDHSLHGGWEGFDKKLWQADTFKNEEAAGVRLTYLSRHMEEGFPGNLQVSVTYSWNNRHELRIDYTAVTDQPTHINLTNHSYFNLNGGTGDILEHEVIIHADEYTETDHDLLPTGRLRPVDDPGMDFRKPKAIAYGITQIAGNGYDHNYILKGQQDQLQPAAKAVSHSTGIRMEVLTTEPGLQFYTANHLDGTLSRGQHIFKQHAGLCFEAQHFPDTPNHTEFPVTILHPEDIFQSTTIYRFSVID